MFGNRVLVERFVHRGARAGDRAAQVVYRGLRRHAVGGRLRRKSWCPRRHVRHVRRRQRHRWGKRLGRVARRRRPRLRPRPPRKQCRRRGRRIRQGRRGLRMAFGEVCRRHGGDRGRRLRRPPEGANGRRCGSRAGDHRLRLDGGDGGVGKVALGGAERHWQAILRAARGGRRAPYLPRPWGLGWPDPCFVRNVPALSGRTV